MNGVLLLVGRVAGAVGLIVTLVAMLMRLAGRFHVGGLATGTLLQGGMAALLVACFCLLLVLAARNP